MNGKAPADYSSAVKKSGNGGSGSITFLQWDKEQVTRIKYGTLATPESIVYFFNQYQNKLLT